MLSQPNYDPPAWSTTAQGRGFETDSGAYLSPERSLVSCKSKIRSYSFGKGGSSFHWLQANVSYLRELPLH